MKKDLMLPGLVIALGAGLRLFRLGALSFWCDEFLALALAVPPAGAMMRWVAVHDAHPPLFYLLTGAVARFGIGEYALRFLPALAGIASLVVFHRLVKRFGREPSWLCLLLFALSPAAILWSRMVKSYSLLTLFGLLSVFFYLAWRERPSPKNAAGWAGATALAMYTHNYGVFFPAGAVVFAVLRRRELPPLRALMPLAAVFLLYLPWLAGPLFSQLAFVRGAVHSITNPFLRAGYAFFYFVFGETLFPLEAALVVPGGAVFALLALSGLSSRGAGPLLVFARVMLVLALGAIFAVPATIPQNLVHLQPFFFLVAAAGLARFLPPPDAGRPASAPAPRRINPHRFYPDLCRLVPVLFLLPPLYFYYRGESRQFHDVSKLLPYREAAAFLEREAAAGEVILFTERRDGRFSDFFPPRSPWDWYFHDGRVLREFNRESAGDPPAALEPVMARYDGFWLLVNRVEYHDWHRELRRHLADLQAEGKLVKIRGCGMLENRSFRSWLAGQPRPPEYFLEIYHFHVRDGA